MKEDRRKGLEKRVRLSVSGLLSEPILAHTHLLFISGTETQEDWNGHQQEESRERSKTKGPS